MSMVSTVVIVHNEGTGFADYVNGWEGSWDILDDLAGPKYQDVGVLARTFNFLDAMGLTDHLDAWEWTNPRCAVVVWTLEGDDAYTWSPGERKRTDAPVNRYHIPESLFASQLHQMVEDLDIAEVTFTYETGIRTRVVKVD